MDMIETRVTAGTLNETALLSNGKWATLLDQALQSGKAYRIECQGRNRARGIINVLYKITRSDRYVGKFSLHRRGAVLYVIPVA